MPSHNKLCRLTWVTRAWCLDRDIAVRFSNVCLWAPQAEWHLDVSVASISKTSTTGENKNVFLVLRWTVTLSNRKVCRFKFNIWLVFNWFQIFSLLFLWMFLGMFSASYSVCVVSALPAGSATVCDEAKTLNVKSLYLQYPSITAFYFIPDICRALSVFLSWTDLSTHCKGRFPLNWSLHNISGQLKLRQRTLKPETYTLHLKIK